MLRALSPIKYPDGMIEAIIDYLIEVQERDNDYYHNLIHPQTAFHGRLFFKLLLAGKPLSSADNLELFFKQDASQSIILAFGERATRIQPAINAEIATECSTLVNDFLEPLCSHSKWLTFLEKIKDRVHQPGDLQRLKIKLAGALGHKFLSALEVSIIAKSIICDLKLSDISILNKIILSFINTTEVKPQITFHQQKQKFLVSAIFRKFKMDLLIASIKAENVESINEEAKRLKKEIDEIHASADFKALGIEGCTTLIMHLHSCLIDIHNIEKNTKAKKLALTALSNVLLDYLTSQYNEIELINIKETADNNPLSSKELNGKDEQERSDVMTSRMLLQVIKSLFELAFKHGESHKNRKLYKERLEKLLNPANSSPAKDAKQSPRLTSPRPMLSPRAANSFPLLAASSPRTTDSTHISVSSPRIMVSSPLTASSPRSAEDSPLTVVSPRAAEASSPSAASSPRLVLSPRITRSLNTGGTGESETPAETRRHADPKKIKLKRINSQKKINVATLFAKPQEEGAPQLPELVLPVSPPASPVISNRNDDSDHEYTSRIHHNNRHLVRQQGDSKGEDSKHEDKDTDKKFTY